MKTIVSLSLLLLAISFRAGASHIMGGELTYKYLGSNGPTDRPFRYSIHFVAYVDRVSGSSWPCGNLGANTLLAVYDAATSQRIPRIAGAGSNDQICWKLPSHGNAQGLCEIDPYSFPAIRPLVIPGSACWDTTQLPLSIAITDTTFEVQLPFSAGGYYVKYESCCRTMATSNLNVGGGAGGSPGNTWQAFIPSPSMVNSSPQFSGDLIPVICLGDTSYFSMAATDADGDNLLYSLATPWSGGTSTPVTFSNPANVTYSNQYSAQQPLGPNGHVSINPATGLLKLYSATQGVFALAFDVAEYRTLAGGTQVLVSTTRREYVFIVKQSSLPPVPVYVPLSRNDANWNIKKSNLCQLSPGELRMFYTIRCDGDTVIGNKTYRKLDIPYYYADPTASCVVSSYPGEYAGAIREDSLQRKVYFIYDANDPEELLYDFSMAVGDTLKGHLSGPMAPYIVVSTGSVATAGGVIRKQWNLVFSGCPIDTVWIIEGIGSLSGLTTPPVTCNSDVDRHSLMCMSTGGTTRYMASGTTSCAVITANAHLVSVGGIELYPNPAEESITLEAKGNILSVEITDGLGRTVDKEGFTQSEAFLENHRLNIRHLKPGIYQVKIQTEEGTAVQKLVKK